MSGFLSNLFEQLDLESGNGEKSAAPKSAKGEEVREFQIDGNGEAKETVEEKGYGATVEFTAVITDPNDEFEIEVVTNGEGGLKPTKISTGEKISFTIKMRSFLRTTKVEVALKSSLRNTSGKVKISYEVV